MKILADWMGMLLVGWVLSLAFVMFTLPAWVILWWVVRA